MDTFFRKSRRGSVLLVTILLGTGIALALGSFITLTVTSLKLSNRSFHANSALNLSEAGLEVAVSAANRADWSGWSTHASGAHNRIRTLSAFDLGQGTTGQVRMIVYGATSSPTPRIVSEGMASPNVGPPITKQIEVRLHRRSHWATGLVARDRIVFSGGNATVDSYKSNDPNYSTGGLYDASKRRDRGTAGSLSVTTDAIAISNSDIWGFVATGGSQPQAGPNGTIRGPETPGGVRLDPNRITTDFTANFEPVAVPNTSGYDVYGNISGDETLGSAGTSTRIVAANMSNTNNRTIEVLGDVTLVVTNEIDIKGTLVVRPNSSLTLYVHGDMDVGGNGAINETGIPANLIIYGTNPTIGGHTMKLNGNGTLHAAVFAPNAVLEMKGGGSSGEMSGSVVAHSITVTGNYAFHYDEALEEENGGNPFAVSLWRELVSSADRITF